MRAPFAWAGAVALAFSAATAASADVYELNLDNGSTHLIDTSPYSAVTIMQKGANDSRANPPGSLSTFFSAGIFNRTLGPEGKSATGVIDGGAPMTQVLGLPKFSSWAMMLIGLAGIGYAAFRRGGQRPERLALGI
jgi:hypothetical protein